MAQIKLQVAHAVNQCRMYKMLGHFFQVTSKVVIIWQFKEIVLQVYLKPKITLHWISVRFSECWWMANKIVSFLLKTNQLRARQLFLEFVSSKKEP